MAKRELFGFVSTHSRPKAAGCGMDSQCPPDDGFNTQPPEGGWETTRSKGEVELMFQHTAARRRLDTIVVPMSLYINVSTHSRPKAAGS